MNKTHFITSTPKLEAIVQEINPGLPAHLWGWRVARAILDRAEELRGETPLSQFIAGFGIDEDAILDQIRGKACLDAETLERIAQQLKFEKKRFGYSHGLFEAADKLCGHDPATLVEIEESLLAMYPDLADD